MITETFELVDVHGELFKVDRRTLFRFFEAQDFKLWGMSMGAISALRAQAVSRGAPGSNMTREDVERAFA